MEGLTDEMRALLNTGADTHYGRCCYPRDLRDRKISDAAWALKDAGLIFWGDNGETPIITDKGREVIGAPAASARLARELAELSS